MIFKGLLARITKWLIESEKKYNKFWIGQMKPCPLCGHDAALIHYCGENKPEFWDIECGDLDDHGAWSIDGKCHFHCKDGMKEIPRHYTIKDAVLYWNEVVVPIGIAARKAMIRMQEYKEGKRNRFDVKSVELPPFDEEKEEKKDGK